MSPSFMPSAMIAVSVSADNTTGGDRLAAKLRKTGGAVAIAACTEVEKADGDFFKMQSDHTPRQSRALKAARAAQ